MIHDATYLLRETKLHATSNVLVYMIHHAAKFPIAWNMLCDPPYPYI